MEVEVGYITSCSQPLRSLDGFVGAESSEDGILDEGPAQLSEILHYPRPIMHCLMKMIYMIRRSGLWY